MLRFFSAAVCRGGGPGDIPWEVRSTIEPLKIGVHAFFVIRRRGKPSDLVMSSMTHLADTRLARGFVTGILIEAMNTVGFRLSRA